MSTLSANSGRDTVEVHNRLDQVVLAVSPHDAGSASTNLTADGAREIARALEEAADIAERTQAS